jgi:hypothetical protein
MARIIEKEGGLNSVHPDYIVQSSDDGLEDATPDHATFCVTSAIEDYDGDVVYPPGLVWSDFEARGAPWFAFHQNHPWTVGSSLDPATGRLAVQVTEDKAFLTVWWDMDDPVGRYVARKVYKGLKRQPGGMRCCSLAFVPLESFARDRSAEKGQYDRANRTQGPAGFFFRKAAVSECSLVGVGANPEALLVDAPDTVRKCFGLGCRTKGKAAWEKALAQSCYDVTEAWSITKGRLKAANQADMEGGDGAGLIDRTQSAIPNYRRAADRRHSCGTCAAFSKGRCLMFDAPVEAHMTCDEWTDDYDDAMEKAAGMGEGSGTAGGYTTGPPSPDSDYDDKQFDDESNAPCDCGDPDCDGDCDKCVSCKGTGRNYGGKCKACNGTGMRTAGALLDQLEEAKEFDRAVKHVQREQPAWAKYLAAQAEDNMRFAREVGAI